ncbi:hypothetical protein KZP23_07015 [Echinicola marina]|uniref:hypothetical protein n=1 Tax=Echinicola marina TaxID=2859768 RepID=UPI001CF6B4CB|nr:hypothetical protein [Echinicola marina]UCS94754.1 hypothetical protein KZP23_07015 [Echinicola marina]
MKKLLKILNQGNLCLMLGLVMLSCLGSDEDGSNGYSELKMNLTATASEDNIHEGVVHAGGMLIKDFGLDLRDLSIGYFSEAGINAGFDRLETLTFSEGKDAYSGPHFKLVEDGNLQSNLLGEKNAPNGLYQEVTFQLGNSTGSGIAHSLDLEGNFEGKTVKIWTENTGWLKASAINVNAYAVYTNSELTLVVDFQKLFEGLDISLAQDGNGDGKIEIGPNNLDGNQSLLLIFEQNLQAAFHLQQ